jgi:hypothetical protein
MEETLLNKRIIEKINKKKKSLAFYIAVNKVETLNKP